MTSPLHEDVLKELHGLLNARKTKLARLLREQLLTLEEARGPVGDHEIRDTRDTSFIAAMAEVRLADADREIEEIRDINNAIARMHGGVYGICSDCGEAIPEARLRAYPAAKRCRECQELKEQARSR